MTTRPLVPIVLAAGVGKRFGTRTTLSPKCLIPINAQGQTLLERYLDSFRALRLERVILVVGHLKEQIMAKCADVAQDLSIQFVTNNEFRKGSIVSLHKACPLIQSDILVMDADVYFPTEALKTLIDHPAPSALLIDTRSVSTGEEMMLMAKQGRAIHIAKKMDPSLDILGEATGLVKFDFKTAKMLANILKQMIEGKIENVEYEEAYSALMKIQPISWVPIGDRFWSEMDFEEDLAKILKNG